MKLNCGGRKRTCLDAVEGTDFLKLLVFVFVNKRDDCPSPSKSPSTTCFVDEIFMASWKVIEKHVADLRDSYSATERIGGNQKATQSAPHVIQSLIPLVHQEIPMLRVRSTGGCLPSLITQSFSCEVQMKANRLFVSCYSK